MHLNLVPVEQSHTLVSGRDLGQRLVNFGLCEFMFAHDCHQLVPVAESDPILLT